MSGQQIGYIRVSTTEQNISRQLDGLKLDRVFVDKCGGKDTNRPQLEALMAFIRDGDALIVHSMDRLARNLDDLRKLVKNLTNRGVIIKFIKEGIDFSGQDNAMSKLLLSVMGAFAEFERELINERIREGVAIAKKAGKYRGRSKCLTDEQIAEVKLMAANRFKKTDIAKKLGISRGTVYNCLSSDE
jgi:DNA invertase Pin-like site-specific DNA recombinase